MKKQLKKSNAQKVANPLFLVFPVITIDISEL